MTPWFLEVTAQSLVRFADTWGSDYRHVQDPELLLHRDGRIEVLERMRAFILTSRELDRGRQHRWK